jgi:hypothetical protein
MEGARRTKPNGWTLTNGIRQMDVDKVNQIDGRRMKVDGCRTEVDGHWMEVDRCQTKL